MSRTLLLSFTLCFVGAVACSDQHLTSPLTLNQSSARNLAIERGKANLWKGSCAGNVRFVDATHLDIRGTCQFAHVGRVTFTIQQELTFGQVITYSGKTTYTALNGDEFYTTHVGIATPTPDGLGVSLAGTETALGGTGRFAGASGSATITGMSFLFGPKAGTGFYDLLGTLSFDRTKGEDSGDHDTLQPLALIVTRDLSMRRR